MKEARTISAALFAVLFAFEMVLMRYVMAGAGITANFVIVGEVLMALLFGVFSIYLFARREALCESVRRMVRAAGCLYVICMIVHYEMHVYIFMTGLVSFGAQEADAGLPAALMVGVKLVLLVLGVLFAVAPPKIEQIAKEREDAAENSIDPDILLGIKEPEVRSLAGE